MVRAMRSSSMRYLNTVSYIGFARYNFMIIPSFLFIRAKIHHLFETGKAEYVFMRKGTTALVAFPLSISAEPHVASNVRYIAFPLRRPPQNTKL